MDYSCAVTRQDIIQARRYDPLYGGCCFLLSSSRRGEADWPLKNGTYLLPLCLNCFCFINSAFLQLKYRKPFFYDRLPIIPHLNNFLYIWECFFIKLAHKTSLIHWLHNHIKINTRAVCSRLLNANQ